MERERGTAAGDRPSATSRAVACWRATFDRPVSGAGDPHAQRALCRGMRTPPDDTPLLRELRTHVAARTRVIDGRALAAADGAVDQVVVVGAGYDDRALRFAAPGLRFFEVDRPVTQASKRRRVDRADPTGARHPTFVPADVVADDLAAALAAAGHDPRASTLFVCEGLLVYLEPADVVGLLAVLASAAGPGSELVATLAVHPDGLPSDAVVEAANAARPDGTVEPWRTVLPRGEHLGLLTSAGWTVDDVVDDADVLPGAVAGRSLTVTASPTAA